MARKDDGLLKGLQAQRRYEGAFNWSDKRVKEHRGVRTLLEAMAAEGDTRFCNPRPSAVDPPDCVVDGPNGGFVGIEVTELVDEEVVRANEQAQEREDREIRLWRMGDVWARVAEIVKAKDSKPFSGAPYSMRLLLIQCDEPHITSPDFDVQQIGVMPVCTTSQIDEAYLLLSYHPDPGRGGGRYPYVRLPVSKEGAPQ